MASPCATWYPTMASNNEANGENNQDGPDYNFKFGTAGQKAYKKKGVLELRDRQMKNAFALVLLAQGALHSGRR